MEIKANIKKIYKIISEFIDKLDENHIYLTSAGIAFNIILYQIPLFLLVTFIVDLTIGFENLAIELEFILKEFLPPTASSSKYITKIISEINDIVNHSSFFGIIGMVVLVWISSTLISSLRYSINRVFRIAPLKTAFLDMLKDMLLVILIPFLFIAYTFLLPLVDILLSFLAEFSPETFQGVISNFTVIITSLGTGFIIYYFIYSYIPSKKVERKKRFFAAILNTILIEISRNIFAWYLINLSQYSKYYGAYATVVSIALWIYYFAFIFLISAEVSQMYFEKKENQKEELEFVE